MYLGQFAQAGVRMRFLAVGVIALALGGCVTSSNKVDPTDGFVAFEAEVPRNFIKFGECLVDEKKRNSFEPDYYLYGVTLMATTYQISMSDEPSGKASTLMRIRRIEGTRSKLSITPPYDPVTKSFRDIAGLDQLIANCVDGPLENVQQYSDNSKPFDVEFDREFARQFMIKLISVKLPAYEAEKPSTTHMLSMMFRARIAPKDKQFFEPALAGDLKPFEAFYTREFYSVSAGEKGLEAPNLQILAEPLEPYLKEADPKVYSMFCSGYAVSDETTSVNQETDERIVVLVQNNLIRDAMIVSKDHPFYQKCLQGTEIHS